MNKEALREIYKKYELTADDVFVQTLGGKEIPTITRTGVEKVQAKIGIELKYVLENISPDHKHVVVKCIGTYGDGVSLESYGEASPDNNKQKYPIAMAEKRAKARVVLQVAGFYQLGVYSEDEFNK